MKYIKTLTHIILPKIKIYPSVNIYTIFICILFLLGCSEENQIISSVIFESKQSEYLISNGDNGGADYTNSIGMEFMFIAPGQFNMGNNGGNSDQSPIHEVEITEGYYLGKYEVTQSQWYQIMGYQPSYFKPLSNGNGYPVEQISWIDIQTFIDRLNEIEGVDVYRLPTEAEWEYAAQGGAQSSGFTYSGSNNVIDVAWYSSISNSRTKEVGTKAPNELGLYDMSGNVWEWCNDWYSEDYYSISTRRNPLGPEFGTEKVIRGGSYASIISPSVFSLEVTNRFKNSPTDRSTNMGFRLRRVAN